jgi:hypothetical protein
VATAWTKITTAFIYDYFNKGIYSKTFSFSGNTDISRMKHKAATVWTKITTACIYL